MSVTYALAALLGALAVWVANKLTRGLLPYVETEYRIKLYNSGAEEWQHIGVKTFHCGYEPPNVAITDIPSDPKVVPTWIAMSSKMPVSSWEER